MSSHDWFATSEVVVCRRCHMVKSLMTYIKDGQVVPLQEDGSPPDCNGDHGDVQELRLELASHFIAWWSNRFWENEDQASEIFSLDILNLMAKLGGTVWQPINVHPPHGTVADLRRSNGQLIRGAVYFDEAPHWRGGHPHLRTAVTHWRRAR